MKPGRLSRYEIDLHSMMGKRADRLLKERVAAVNKVLVEKALFSTSRLSDYDKLMDMGRVRSMFPGDFMSPKFFKVFAGHAVVAWNGDARRGAI